MSNYYPDFMLDDSGNINVYVRGKDTSCNDKVLDIPIEHFPKFKEAVEEYNDSSKHYMLIKDIEEIQKILDYIKNKI